MKSRKCIVVLAVVGLAAIGARAEEKVNSVVTALSATTLSGYVDTSAQWNFGTGNGHMPLYKFGGPSKADGFNFNVAQVRIEHPLSEETWAAGYRVDLWAGPDANVLNTGSTISPGVSDFAVRQAYVLLQAPLENGLLFKVGVFDSILGYESVESPSDPNYTRSYGHSIEPQTHTGVLMSYKFNDIFHASAGIANTMGPHINERAQGPNFSDETKAESFKTYMGSIDITAPESMGFLAGSMLYVGVANGFSSSPDAENETSYYAGATLATPMTGLRLGVAFDALDVHNRGGETWAVGCYASFQPPSSEKLSFHVRGEYLRDRGDQKFFTADATDPDASFNPDKVMAWTATVQYDLWKNVLSRLELRWDHSLNSQETWGGKTSDDSPNLKNAWMLAANVIYKF